MEEFSKTVKLNPDVTLTIYRGENVDSAKGDDAFSWTLDKKTAKFFADRFSKGSGRIIEKTIKVEEVIDYLDDRGESEVILFPKKFGILKESLEESIIGGSEHIDFPIGGKTRVVFSRESNSIETINFHPNLGKITWFELDKDGNFHTDTTASEFFIFKQFYEFIKNPPATHRERTATLLSWEPFKAWIDSCTEKYRIKLTGERYGL